MQRQRKPSAWVALGVICFSISVSNYLNSLQARTTGVDSVSNKSDVESTQSLNSLEQSVYQQINDYRASKGLPPLVLNDWLTQHAREHSQAMVRGKVSFNQQGLQQRNETISQSGPYQKICLLIAMNQGHPAPARTAVNSWLNDPLNRSLPDVEGDYEFTGVGVAMNVKGEYYFTQIFLRR
jgi:uncharacterized protein YkwD